MREGWIVVTGASRGIGAAIATDLERRGARVAGLSRSGAGGAGRAIACDVSDEAALTAAFASLAEEGPIVGLVNNAGQHTAAPSALLATADFEKVMQLNATAVFVASRIAHPHLARAGGGMIVNIGSFFDKLGVAENLAYCASKAAVGAMTRCLAVEWAKDDIRVLDIAPGYVETDLNRDFLARDKTKAWMERRIPAKRAARADEIARLVGVLFQEDIAYLTGETIYVDGGQGMNH
ncbi:SDR family NAD(P)-dependent oxidoreductase [uncultured Enterovirga sp.]|uniref:SDR family NAD(P)-dependent oxidoreductase n=1 Tax=uncultured Enterovirga sp. TaxID=2026352 RepID=UPI0035CBBEAC